MKAGNKDYSIVVPVFNSEENIERLVASFNQLFIRQGLNAELLLVDDASRDATWIKTEEAALKNKFVTAIRLKHNSGQVAATTCGIHNSTGNIIITMDDDLQYPMEEAMKLLNHFKTSDKTVLFGYPRKRMHNFKHKAAVWLIMLLFDYVLMLRYRKINFYTTFRIFRRNLFFDSDNRILQRHLFYVWEIPVEEMGSVPIEHERRRTGQSTYTLIKKIRLLYPAMAFCCLRLSTITAMLLIFITIFLAVLQQSSTMLLYFLSASVITLLILRQGAAIILNNERTVRYEIQKIIK